MGEKATGRPTQPLPLLPRALLLLAVAVAILEGVFRLVVARQVPAAAGPLVVAIWPALIRYGQLRIFCLEHPVGVALVALVVVGLVLVAYRYGLIIWHNHIAARLTGTFFQPEQHGFPRAAVNVLREIQRRPKGHYFVGVTPRRFGFWQRMKPVYVTATQRSMHGHILGKTGSGKTASLIWPITLQDALDGLGVAVMDAKGSDENVRMMKGIASVADRYDDLLVFALPAWNNPQIPTHTYNMLYVRPRNEATGDAGGDVEAMAQRVFSVLPLGDNAYYNTQALIVWTNLCKLMHGMVDGEGRGIPFTMRDMAVALKGIGNKGCWAEALDHLMTNSRDTTAAKEIQSQFTRLGNDVNKAFSGIVGAVDKFLAPIVNAYDPDICFEEILEQNKIVYIQLPANLFKIQAPAMGKVMLMDIQQEGSLRQVFRHQRNQTPFSVTIDEFYNFADDSIIDSLNKLRDAKLQYTLAHQSISDLERISKEFAGAVWDNTRTKHILNQDSPELCERVGKSLGTHQVVERTVRQQEGALFTSLVTGDASTKLVETYRLHPNAIKNLAPCGQGYLYNDTGLFAVSYGMLPKTLEIDVPLRLKDQTKARGLRLYEKFIGPAGERLVPASLVDLPLVSEAAP
jgi:hypothetical protein